MKREVVLYTHKICPFAQRVWITLEEKKIPYDLKEVSFIDIDSQFKNIYKSSIARDQNSQGRVPVIINDGKAIAETEKYKGGNDSLIPENSFQRLKMRLFIQKHTKLIDLFYKFRGFHNKPKQQQNKIITSFKKAMEDFNNSLSLPYAIGNQFTIADILLFPWVVRWIYAQKGTGIGIDKKLTKIKQWLQNIQNRQSVKATMQSNQYYQEGYKQYFATDLPIKSIPTKALKPKL